MRFDKDGGVNMDNKKNIIAYNLIYQSTRNHEQKPTSTEIHMCSNTELLWGLRNGAATIEKLVCFINELTEYVENIPSASISEEALEFVKHLYDEPPSRPNT